MKLRGYVNAVIWNRLGNNILHGYTLGKLKKNENYIGLQNTYGKDCRRVVLLDTPVHGNLGDQAIALAERDFISALVGKENLFEFTNSECKANLRDIIKWTKDDDFVVIHGGGFLGTLWLNEEKVFIRILEGLREKKILVFPQTIYFEKTEIGDREETRFRNAIKACSDITIFTRDRNSYEWLKESAILPPERFYLVPDIVMSYQIKNFEHKKREKLIWLCLRGDMEKNFDSNTLNILTGELKELGYRVELTDTVVDGEIGQTERYHAVYAKLEQFAKGALVITDRLHGMVFSALSATPCIALDNISKKVSGGYEWLRHLDYVKCVTNREVTMELVQEMLLKKNCRYDNECLQPHYEWIRKKFDL